MAGFFVAIQMLGYVLSGIILGRLQDIKGTRAVVIITGFATMISPLIALISFWLYKNHYPFSFLYTTLYAFVGVHYSGVWTGILNYLFKIAPEEKRPLYIGLLNTATAPMTFLPAIGGVIIQKFGYVYLFIIAFIMIFAGFLLSLTLKNPE